MTTIKIILARVPMSTSCVFFCFVDFLVNEVSLSFKDTRGVLGLYLLIHSLTLISIFFYPTVE